MRAHSRNNMTDRKPYKISMINGQPEQARPKWFCVWLQSSNPHQPVYVMIWIHCCSNLKYLGCKKAVTCNEIIDNSHETVVMSLKIWSLILSKYWNGVAFVPPASLFPEKINCKLAVLLQKLRHLFGCMKIVNAWGYEFCACIDQTYFTFRFIRINYSAINTWTS